MSDKQRGGSSSRQIAAKVVHDVLETDAFSNKRLSELLDASSLDLRDKNFCTELVYGTLRWVEALKASIFGALERPGKIPPRVLSHMLVAAYQLQHLSETVPEHATVNEAVKSVKKFSPGLAGLTNAVLRKLGSAKHLMMVFEKASNQEISKAYSMPGALIECIKKELPKEEHKNAIESLNQRPHVFIRTFANIGEASDRVEPHPFVPNAFSIESAAAFIKENGSRITVQDPASQIPALLLGPKEGEQVIDLCAAPGMKSLILKQKVGPKGSVTAVELNPAKKKRLVQNMKRLKLPLSIVIGDARKVADDKSLAEAFDHVLLDAPCSGLGTIRRHPEIKLRTSEEKIKGNIKIQQELLEGAAKLLRKGGSLVFSVCSPLPEEGSEQIAWFLKKHPEFLVAPAKQTLEWLPDDCVSPEGFVKLWPHRHQSDAFFAAKLVKS